MRIADLDPPFCSGAAPRAEGGGIITDCGARAPRMGIRHDRQGWLSEPSATPQILDVPFTADRCGERSLPGAATHLPLIRAQRNVPPASLPVIFHR